MRIFITGATGLVGRRLVLDRLQRGDHVVVLSRDGAGARGLFAAEVNPNVTVVEGDPGAPGPWQQAVDGCEALVNLAGAGVADERWSPAYKKRLVDSRIDSTYQVRCAIGDAAVPPRVLVSASAVGYYGDTAGEAVDESAPAGQGFLAELAAAWEEQAGHAASPSTRVAILRIGLVLDERGGALARMAPLFRAGLGGPPGHGRQYVSWIHWRDLIGMADWILQRPGARGAYNATSPTPVTARELARSLGRCLHRPALLRVPGVALRARLGGFADALLACSRVRPRRAIEEGYRFLYGQLDEALHSLLNKPASAPFGPGPLPGAESLAAVPGAAGLELAPAPPPDTARRPAAPIRLVAIGVDGTLLRGDGRLSRGVVQACRAAERAGCVIVLASARPPRGVRSILRALDLVSPTINCNGAAIWNPVEDRPQHHLALDGALAREIVTEARTLYPDLLVGLELLDRWYTDRVDPEFRKASGLVIEPDYVGPLERHFDETVLRLDMLGTPERIDAVVDLLRERYWRVRRIGVFRADRHVVQVTNPLVDKSIALQRIARAMGITKQQVMAIGDGENDLGMLEWSGFAVAVENACPGAHRLADQVVPSNDEHGVARAIQRFVLSGPAEALEEIRAEG